MTVVHSADQVIGSIPTEQTAPPVFDWKAAANGLCDEMLKQAPTQARKVADTLYETLLDTVQDYLRDNVDYNLSADLMRAKRREDCANSALRLVALALDVEVRGFPNYPTPEMLADQCVERIERVTATIEAMSAAIAEATTASAVGTSNASEPNTPAASS